MKNGHQSECRFCMKIRNGNWHKENRERSRVLNRKAVNKMRSKNIEKSIWKSAKDRSKANGLDFDLSIEDVKIPKNCPVFGIELKSHLGLGLSQGLHKKDISPSIDRIDNKKGYTKDNIVIVSYRVNRLKSDSTIEDLKKIVEFYENL